FDDAEHGLRPAATDDPLHTLLRSRPPLPAFGSPLDGAPNQVGFVMPLPQAPEWVLAMTTSRAELYSPALDELGVPLATIVLLVLVGAALTSRAIRPLSERIVRQSEQ